MNINIEITKLYALHKATICCEHAVREVGQTSWRDFTPSRFVYAYFTFNSVYSYDWDVSFKEKKAEKWKPDENNRLPGEEQRFKSYLGFSAAELNAEAPKHFAEQLGGFLARFDIKKPVDELENVDVVNATKRVKDLAKQLPGQFRQLWKPKHSSTDFLAQASAVFSFVYEVRCNLFHGSKNGIQLLEPAQQRRLLIYTATLIAGNSMLFRIAEESKIGWRPVTTSLGEEKGTGGGNSRST